MDNQNLLLLKLLNQDFRNNWPSWKTNLQNSLAKWRNEIITDLSRFLLLLLCVWGGYLVFLYYLQSLWEIFSSTPMGSIFATQVSPEFVDWLTVILDLDIFSLAGNSFLISLAVTIVIGLLSKFTGVYRLTYLNRGVFSWGFWVLICISVSTELFPIIAPPDSFRVNAVLFFFPVSFLLAGSFRFSSRLVPEFTVVFQLIGFLRERLAIIKIRDLPCDHFET
jgi:hypothetical protein